MIGNRSVRKIRPLCLILIGQKIYFAVGQRLVGGADFTQAHTMGHSFGLPHLILFEESGVVCKCQEPQLFVKQTEPIL